MGTLTEVFSNFLLFFLVFGMSATVDIDKLRKQLRNKHALITGVSMQFLILPFVGFLVVKIFQFSAPVGITLLVVTSSPGGSYSNWWCSLFNAELALSVTMTALSTMVSVVMLPMNLVIYASSSYSSAVVKSLDWDALFMSIFVVIGGISSGLFCSAYFKDSPSQSHRMRKAANVFGNIAGICLISYSILVSSSDHQAALWDQSWDFFVGLAIPPVVGIILVTFLATRFNLEKPERVALAVESCYQNTGIATSVAAVMFDSTEDDLATAISVPLYYGIVEMVLLAVFCLICWKSGWTKAPADEKLCVILAKSYEVEQGEPTELAASIEVVLGGDGSSEDADTDCEKVVVGGITKPPLIFEQTDSTEDESQISGAVVLRKVDTTETLSVDGAEPLQSSQRERDVTGTATQGSPSQSSRPQGRSDDPPMSPSGSFSEEGDHEQQHDGSGPEAGGVGRLGKTISFVKARATGYRRAPTPNDDCDCQIPKSQREPGTGILNSAELPDMEYRHRNRVPSSPDETQRNVDKSLVEFPVPPMTTWSQDEANSDGTLVDGKTID